MIDFFTELYSEASKTDIVIIGFIAFLGIVNGLIKIPSWAKFKKEPEPFMCAQHPMRIEKERLRGEKVAEIKYRATVYEQMNKVSIYAEQIKMILMKNFLNRLEQAQGSEAKKSIAKIDYRKDLKIATDEACGYLRKWVKNNHFSEMTDVNFNDYITTRSNEVHEKVSNVLDAYYLSSICLVSREELRKSNEQNCLPEIRTMLSKMFFEIREIAEKKEAEIKKILEEE